MQFLLFVSFVVLAIYGAHLVWESVQHLAKINGKGKAAAIMMLAAMALAFVTLTMPGAPAAAQSLDVDLTPFFDSMNTYLPIFLGVFGVIGGIGAAIMFARFIINAIQSALSGRGV